jgi:hypothetical protein
LKSGASSEANARVRSAPALQAPRLVARVDRERALEQIGQRAELDAVLSS